ncbi:MAG: VCBS repeat-containing protein, partial [Gemmatimonadaceae bacterium]|nr:VCBS repeat-containing protein [Gloeobacterales cyanobacterium ES-bin-141]
VGRNSATGANVVWLMNGTSFVSTVALPSVTNLAWRIGSIGNADFNGDGKVDILWRNESTGANVVWLMNGTSFVSTVTLPTVTNLDWQIRATGDLSSDGRPDILWRNESTGANVAWLMNGTSFVSTVTLPTVTNLDWQMHGPR